MQFNIAGIGQLYANHDITSLFMFVLCLKVACDIGYTGAEGDERLQLVSFHSTSKVTFLAHFRVKHV